MERTKRDFCGRFFSVRMPAFDSEEVCCYSNAHLGWQGPAGRIDQKRMLERSFATEIMDNPDPPPYPTPAAPRDVPRTAPWLGHQAANAPRPRPRRPRPPPAPPRRP